MALGYDIVARVERERNTKYQWLMFITTIGILMVHGIIFHWIPRLLRGRRSPDKLNYRGYFTFLKFWDRLTSCCSIKAGKKKVYFQPSVVFVVMAFCGVSVAFIFSETTDIVYQSYGYVISKRVGRIGMSNLITILVMVMKCDIVGAVTGLQHDRIVFLHKWLGRFMFACQVIHLALAVQYWVTFKFVTMLLIPPQIFGMIGMGFLTLMTLGSLKFIRNFAFDMFLVQHRIFNFFMLLFVYFHNSATHAACLIGVHTLVADRIGGRIVTFLHKRKSPTKGMATFNFLDDNTILVNLPMRIVPDTRWWHRILPKMYWWNPGQHVYLNVSKANLFQIHPFTIASLPDSGKITLVIKVKTGFTRLLRKAMLERQKKHPDEPILMKAAITGPTGGRRQTLIGFDTNLLIGAGVGGSMIFPLALHLLKELKRRDEIDDYLHRPAHSAVKIAWVIQKRSNMYWFHQAINELKPFIKLGKVLLEIYITREKFEADTTSIMSSNDSANGVIEYKNSRDEEYRQMDSSSQIKQSPHEEDSIEKCKSIEIVNTVSSSDSVSTGSVLGAIDYSTMSLEEIKSEIEKEDERLLKRRVRLREQKAKLHEAEVEDWLNDIPNYVSIQYGRLSVRSLIQAETSLLTSKSMKALAINACGPQQMLSEVKIETNQARRIRYSPEIVCHTEGL